MSSFDPCLFIGPDIVVIVYVDDLLIYSPTDDPIDRLIDALKADDALNHDIGQLARLLRVLSGIYDQAARSAASL